MITKNTIIVLEHGAMYDYGEGLKTKLTLGELVKALEKYENQKSSNDPDEYLGGFLESGIVETEDYLDPTAQCAIISFTLSGQKLDVEESWLKEHNCTLSDIREKDILRLDVDFGVMNRVETDEERLESLESFKKLSDTFQARYILDFFKEVLGNFCDIQDIEVHGKELSVGKGDIYQDPESFEPRNNIEGGLVD
jgi:hypothetical protein